MNEVEGTERVRGKRQWVSHTGAYSATKAARWASLWEGVGMLPWAVRQEDQRRGIRDGADEGGGLEIGEGGVREMEGREGVMVF